MTNFCLYFVKLNKNIKKQVRNLFGPKKLNPAPKLLKPTLPTPPLAPTQHLNKRKRVIIFVFTVFDKLDLMDPNPTKSDRC